MTAQELLDAIAAHRDSFTTVPVGGFRRADRVLWALIPPTEIVVSEAQLELGLGLLDNHRTAH